MTIVRLFELSEWSPACSLERALLGEAERKAGTPAGQAHAEHLANPARVESGVRGPSGGARIIRRGYRQDPWHAPAMLPVAGEDGFGELVAADRAAAGQVKRSPYRRQLFRSCFTATGQDLRGGVGKRWRPGWTTDLITDDPQFLAGKLEPKQTGKKAAAA